MTNMKPLVLFVLLCLSLSVFGQKVPQFVDDVYENMFAVMSDGKVVKPKLLLSTNPNEVATYHPQQKKLFVGQKFIDLARGFGADSSNVIAHIFGHELTHILIQQNASIKDVGTGYASSEYSKSLKGINKTLIDSVYERQADEFACFYAHVAGYKTTHIAGKILQEIYDKYQLSDKKLKRYPPLAERILIAETSAKQMTILNDMFENGIVCTLTGNYEMAIAFFETILANKYTSQEVYNNLGVAHLLHAISYMDTLDQPYVFPFEMDIETNLDNTRAGPEDIDYFLKLAKDNFNYAIEHSPEKYSIAHLNLAITYFLLEDEENLDLTLYRLSKDNSFADRGKIIEAIIQHKKGENDNAKALLQSIKHPVAQENLRRLFEHNINRSKRKLRSIEYNIPNIQMEFMSEHAKRSDTLRKAIINGKQFKRLTVQKSDFTSCWWLYSEKNAHYKYHEYVDLKELKRQFKKVGHSNFKSFKFASRTYLLSDNLLLILENDVLSRALLIE